MLIRYLWLKTAWRRVIGRERLHIRNGVRKPDRCLPTLILGWIYRVELFVSQPRFEVDLSMRVSISAWVTLLSDLSTYGVHKGQVSSLAKWLSILNYEGAEEKYNSTLSSASALDGSGWSRSIPGHFTLDNITVTHFIWGWVGLRAGLDGCGKCRLHRVSITGPSSP